MSRNSSSARVADQNLALPESPSDRGLFFKKFLEKGRGISSAVPSSHTMSLSMLEGVDWSRPGTIIELGAGTGPVTEMIVERLRPHHRFIAIENDPDFVEILRRRFPRHTMVQADATRLAETLPGLGVHRVRYVLSGLPTPAFSKRGIVRLARWVREVLEPEGVFIQLTIIPLYYKRFYERLFEDVRFRFVWRNVPPGGVYHCRRPR